MECGRYEDQLGTSRQSRYRFAATCLFDVCNLQHTGQKNVAQVCIVHSFVGVNAALYTSSLCTMMLIGKAWRLTVVRIEILCSLLTIT